MNSALKCPLRHSTLINTCHKVLNKKHNAVEKSVAGYAIRQRWHVFLLRGPLTAQVAKRLKVDAVPGSSESWHSVRVKSSPRTAKHHCPHTGLQIGLWCEHWIEGGDVLCHVAQDIRPLYGDKPTFSSQKRGRLVKELGCVPQSVGGVFKKMWIKVN